MFDERPQLSEPTADGAIRRARVRRALVIYAICFAAWTVVGVMFVIFNLMLSRLSRRLEIRERKRTGTTVERATGLEDQVALDADVV